eukprot:sb/3466184/
MALYTLSYTVLSFEGLYTSGCRLMYRTTRHVCLEACRERKKQIIFRVFSVISLGASFYTVCVKFTRGDIGFFCAAVAVYFCSGLIGGVYSIYLRGKQTLMDEGDAENESSVGSIGPVAGRYEELESDIGEAEVPSEDGVDDDLEPDETRDDDDQTGMIPKSRARFADDSDEPVVKVGARFEDIEMGNSLPRARPQISRQGTQIFRDDDQAKKNKRLNFQRLKKIMRKSMENSSLTMKMSHIFCVPKWYHFFFSSWILKKHLREEPLDQEVVKQLERYNIKKVSYNRNWQRYCEVEGLQQLLQQKIFPILTHRAVLQQCVTDRICLGMPQLCLVHRQQSSKGEGERKERFIL